MNVIGKISFEDNVDYEKIRDVMDSLTEKGYKFKHTGYCKFEITEEDWKKDERKRI